MEGSLDQLLRLPHLETPALVYNISRITDDLNTVREISNPGSVLYAVKACPLSQVIPSISEYVDGFSCSSIFESRIVSDYRHASCLTHFTSPAIKKSELSDLIEFCDYVSLNSLNQFESLSPVLSTECEVGIRVNPMRSFVDNPKYDPSCRHSKLGIPITDILPFVEQHPCYRNQIHGLHVHNNCESTDFNELKRTFDDIDFLLGFLHNLRWINLGGGYLYKDSRNPEIVQRVTETLQSRYSLDVFFEPGSAIIRDAGCLVATVVDVFCSNGLKIAVVDTTVNHAPEVFDYDWSPPIYGAHKGGNFRYKICGASCLAGDTFGEYQFVDPLQIGSRIILMEMGAYTTSKAHFFNGINLPSIYTIDEYGNCNLAKKFQFENFENLFGAESSVAN